jgi:transcriptional regulator with XRE-family HTH domain
MPLPIGLCIMHSHAMTGTALRRLRKRFGWTQRELAERLGLTANHVARLERDEVRITETLARLVTFVAGTMPPTERRKRR